MALYQSLIEHSNDFHLYVFAFDDETYNFLNTRQLKSLTVISLQQFQDDKLLAIKDSRTAAEYCWTCTPSAILYCIKNFGLDHCIYIDADLLFYSNPQVLIDEMKDKSVLITEHRYTAEYDQTNSSGKYCVQFVGFRNDDRGMKALRWWRNACLEWCYARTEDGKFGDQKYIDDWTVRFEGVYELQHLGGGIAPWNVQQYKFEHLNGKIQGTEIATGKCFEVVFFHFHGLKFYKNEVVSLTSSIYEINLFCKKIFYFPYVFQLNKISDAIIKSGKITNPNGAFELSPSKPLNFTRMFKSYLLDIKSALKNIAGSQHRVRLLHNHYYWNNVFK
jgi:hypothetical protein